MATSEETQNASAVAPAAAAPPKIPSVCTRSMDATSCARAVFAAHENLVLADFEGAQGIEEGIWNSISTADQMAGTRLSNDVAGLHRADHDLDYSGPTLAGALLPEAQLDAAADCANATDTMVSLGIIAMSEPSTSSLQDAEKDRREYVSEARKCERYYHLTPQSSDLRSHHFATIDETGPST